MRSRLIGVLASSVFFVLALASPAQAAFPGANGKIAFSSIRTGNSDIYTINPDGSGLTQLTNDPAPEVDPAWSADGKRIAFSRRLPNATDEINVMDADGSNRRLVYDQTEYPGRPAWSPDGSELAMYGIYVIPADGPCCQRRLVSPELDYSNRDPAWSPDGNKIAYANLHRTGRYDIYVVNLTDGSDVNLTPGPEYETMSNWSPDGRFIAIGDEFGSLGIRVMSAEGGNLSVIPGTENDDQPAYSPDGTRLVASTWIFAAQHTQLVTYRRDGSGRTLIPGTERAEGPDWQPASGPMRSDYKNAAEFCKAEWDFWGEAFAERYGGGANALGKCVSGK